MFKNEKYLCRRRLKKKEEKERNKDPKLSNSARLDREQERPDRER